MYVKYLSDFSDVGKCMQDCGILQKSEIMFGKIYQQEVDALKSLIT